MKFAASRVRYLSLNISSYIFFGQFFSIQGLPPSKFKGMNCSELDESKSNPCGFRDGKFSELGVYRANHGPSCTYYSKEELDWASSRAKCAKDFANLLIIKEYKAVRPPDNAFYWFGENDKDAEGVFTYGKGNRDIAVSEKSDSILKPYNTEEGDCLAASTSQVILDVCTKKHKFACMIEMHIEWPLQIYLPKTDYARGENIEFNCTTSPQKTVDNLRYVEFVGPYIETRVFGMGQKDTDTPLQVRRAHSDLNRRVIDIRCIPVPSVEISVVAEDRLFLTNIKCCDADEECIEEGPLRILIPSEKPTASFLGTDVTSLGPAPLFVPATAHPSFGCRADVGGYPKLSILWVEWNNNRQGKTLWSKTFAVEQKPSDDVWQFPKGFVLTKINSGLNSGKGKPMGHFIEFEIRPTVNVSFRQTRFLCRNSDPSALTIARGFTYGPIIDVYFLPESPEMTSAYKTSNPTVYGGDTLQATCEADIGTLDKKGGFDNMAGIEWHLLTKGKTYRLDSKFTGAVKTAASTYPDWISLKSSPAVLKCPAQFYTSESTRSCFQRFSDLKTWWDARKFCQLRGMDLPLIFDLRTNNELIDHTNRYWIGLNDIDQEGDYEWLNGIEMPVHSVLKFDPKEQLKSLETKEQEDCFYVLQSWHMDDCNNTLGFICMSPFNTIAKPYRKTDRDHRSWRPPTQISNINITVTMALDGATLKCRSFSDRQNLSAFYPDGYKEADFRLNNDLFSKTSLTFRVFFETKAPKIGHQHMDEAKKFVRVKCFAHVGESDVVLRWRVTASGAVTFLYDVGRVNSNTTAQPEFILNITDLVKQNNLHGVYQESIMVLKLEAPHLPIVACYPRNISGGELRTRLNKDELVVYLDFRDHEGGFYPDETALSYAFGILCLVCFLLLLLLCLGKQRKVDPVGESSYAEGEDRKKTKLARFFEVSQDGFIRRPTVDGDMIPRKYVIGTSVDVTSSGANVLLKARTSVPVFNGHDTSQPEPREAVHDNKGEPFNLT